LSSTPEFNETQLAESRKTAWNQVGEGIHTLDAARDWVNKYGIVLFAPRAAQLPSPAPSLVEATLGTANAAPTFAETEAARGLVSRLVGEGLALPLNLLNVPGDSPDFVVSAQVFSYIFTMRGDKAWKQAPATTGAVKVSPLGLRVFEVLTERGPMSAAELALELGREVTEAAILRTLSELWSQLRVLPLLQVGDGVTLWELTTRRFTKAIKAGANAGQPKAISALVSLYLAQVIAATEEEIVTFLSPLTARSRLREVVHALTSARQLETVVLDGKTLLHIPGALPAFAAAAAEVGEDGEPVVPFEKPKKIGTGRISKFSDDPERKAPSEFRGKPARTFAKPVGGAQPSARFSAAKPAGAKFGASKFATGKPDSERRPFKKDGAFAKPAGKAPYKTKPTFDKPWDEDRKPAAPTVKDAFTKFRKPAPEDREPLGAREQAGLPIEKRTPPKSSFDRAPKVGGFVKRPYTPRDAEGGERPTFKPRSYERRESSGTGKPSFGAKKPYAPRATEGGERSFTKPAFDRGAKPAYGSKPSFGSKPAFGDKPAFRPRPGFGEKTSYGAKNGEGKRPSYGSKPTYGSKPGFGGKPAFGAKRPFTPRSAEGAETPYAAKRPYTPRTSDGGERPYAKKPFTPRAPRSSEGSYPKRTFTPREEPSSTGGGVERTLPKRPHKPRAADADKRIFTKDPWVPTAEDRPKPKRSSGSRSGPRYGGKPGGGRGRG
jgi:23S rRNA pseudouridine2605 synthase